MTDGKKPGRQQESLDDDSGEESSRPQLADQREVPEVYGAAEDSHLLARTVAEMVEPGDRALDVGTGSGYVAVALRDAGAEVVGVDVNPHACATAASVGVQTVRGDLVSAFGRGTFDVVACNPPYLPTPAEKEWDDWMEAALSGGEDGRRMIEPLLDDVGRVLAPDGRCFLLVSSLTDIQAVLDYGADRGLVGEEVGAEKHAFERLVVLAFERA